MPVEDFVVNELCQKIARKLVLDQTPTQLTGTSDQKMDQLETAMGLTPCTQGAGAQPTLTVYSMSGLLYTTTVREGRYYRLKTASGL